MDSLPLRISVDDQRECVLPAADRVLLGQRPGHCVQQELVVTLLLFLHQLLVHANIQSGHRCGQQYARLCLKYDISKLHSTPDSVRTQRLYSVGNLELGICF